MMHLLYETPVTNTAPNIINQGGGGEDNKPPGPKTFDKGFSSLNFGLGTRYSKQRCSCRL